MEQESEGFSPIVLVFVLLALVVAAAAFVVPSIMPSRIASNECAAVACLRACLAAQKVFRKTDFYGIGKKVYANTRDGTGFPDLYQVGHGTAPRGEVIRLVDIQMAQAKPKGGDKAGYCFADFTGDADGPYDPETECGLSAAPASYNRSGRNVFIVDVTGMVYQRDAAAMYPGLATGAAVTPLTIYPDDAELATSWIPVGSE